MEKSKQVDYTGYAIKTIKTCQKSACRVPEIPFPS